MNCILHIGVEKTGTSAIQKWLYLNYAILLRHGFLCTKSTGIPNNRELAVAAFNPQRRDDFTRHRRLTSDQALLAFQRQVVETLGKELNQARVNAEVSRVLFSSEHIHSRLCTAAELARLKQILIDLGFKQFTVIVYLRNPVDAAEALYSTAIYSGSIAPLPPPDNAYYRNICDHRQTLVRFSKTFGSENVRPRLYIPKEFPGGSIIPDFMQAIECNIPATAMSVPGRVNERMGWRALRVMRRLNQVGNPRTSRTRRRLQRLIRHMFSLLFRNDPGFTMSAELRAQYEAAFAEGNEWVRKEYFPERQRLFN